MIKNENIDWSRFSKTISLCYMYAFKLDLFYQVKHKSSNLWGIILGWHIIVRMTTLGNSELFGCCSFSCVGYHCDCFGFYIEETICYTIVLLLSTIVLCLQGLLFSWLTWVPVTGWLVVSGYDVEGEMHFMMPMVSWILPCVYAHKPSMSHW